MIKKNIPIFTIRLGRTLQVFDVSIGPAKGSDNIFWSPSYNLRIGSCENPYREPCSPAGLIHRYIFVVSYHNIVKELIITTNGFSVQKKWWIRRWQYILIHILHLHRPLGRMLYIIIFTITLMQNDIMINECFVEFQKKNQSYV